MALSAHKTLSEVFLSYPVISGVHYYLLVTFTYHWNKTELSIIELSLLFVFSVLFDCTLAR